MNQKNIFTIIAALMILQGISFFIMDEKLAQDSFPGLGADGVAAVAVILTVASCLSILLGLVTYASRNNAEVVWAFAIGATILALTRILQ